MLACLRSSFILATKRALAVLRRSFSSMRFAPSSRARETKDSARTQQHVPRILRRAHACPSGARAPNATLHARGERPSLADGRDRGERTFIAVGWGRQRPGGAALMFPATMAIQPGWTGGRKAWTLSGNGIAVAENPVRLRPEGNGRRASGNMRGGAVVEPGICIVPSRLPRASGRTWGNADQHLRPLRACGAAEDARTGVPRGGESRQDGPQVGLQAGRSPKPNRGCDETVMSGSGMKAGTPGACRVAGAGPGCTQ